MTLSCNPSTLNTGAASSCTVQLPAAAPSGGTSVVLTSTSPAVTVPATVLVAAGSLTATFSATAASVSSSTAASVVASYSGNMAVASLTVLPPPVPSSLICSPASLLGGASSSCTITMTGAAPTGGLSVALSSSIAAAKTPASVTVPAGAASTTFSVTTSPVTTGQSAVITASSGGTSQTATLTLTASAAAPLSGLLCTMPSVSGTPMMANSTSAACTVTTSSASAVAQTFNLSSSSAALTVPASVVIPAGAISASFTATSGTLSALTQTATITASASGVTKSFSLTLSVLVSSLVCTPSAIRGTSATSCTITLSEKAPAAATVAVSSSTGLAVPASVTVPSGSASATFTGTIAGDPLDTVVTVSAALSGIAGSATVTVGPVPVKSLSCTPATLTAGQNSACMLTLVAPAPSTGQPVTITTSSAKLSAPSSATVPAAATSYAFTVTALTGYAGPVQVTVKAGGGTATATISGAKVRMISGTPQMACSPLSVEPGGIVTCGIHLPAEASSGATISLRSSHPSLKVPAAVESRPNQNSVTFQAVVDAAAPSGAMSIAASLGGAEAQDQILIQRSRHPVLSVLLKQRALVGSKLSFQVAASSNSGVAPLLRAGSLPSGASFDPSTGQFEWAPSQPGRSRVTFTAIDEAGLSTSADVAIQAGSGAPEIESVQNAASASTDSVCTSGSLASISGEWLDLAGIRVRANGQYLPVVSASPTELTFACPAVAAGAEVSVTVETAAGSSAPAKFTVRDSAPGIFTVDGSGRGQATATILNASRLAMPRNYLYPSQPAQPGDPLSIHMTGLPANLDAACVMVNIAGVRMPADFVRPLAGAPGVYEIGVTIPRSAPLGDSVPVTVELLSGGNVVASQSATIAIEE